MTYQPTILQMIVTLMLLPFVLVACGDEVTDQALSGSTETATKPAETPTATPTQAATTTQVPATPTPEAPTPTLTSTPEAVPAPAFVVDLPDPPQALLSYGDQVRIGVPGVFHTTQCADGICETTEPLVSDIPKPSASDRLAVPMGADLIFRVDGTKNFVVTKVVAYSLDPQLINSQSEDQQHTNAPVNVIDLPVHETSGGVTITANLPADSYSIAVDVQIGEVGVDPISFEGFYSFRVITTPQPEDCSWSSSGSYRQINSIEELAWGSHRIVVGTVVEALLPVWGIAANSLEPNRRNIYTNDVFQVEQMLRGTPAETILVRQYGGTIGGCSQADMDAPPLIPGDRLLLFLTKPSDDTRPSEPAYFITGGPQGYFSVQLDGKVTTEMGVLVPSAGLDLDIVIQRIYDTLAGPPALRANDSLLVPIDESPAATAVPGP